MGRNEIVDSIALLTPVFERLRQVRAGLSEDTVRIVHIGDSMCVDISIRRLRVPD